MNPISKSLTDSSHLAMKQTASATVVAINEEGLWVEPNTTTGCTSCAANKSCGTSALATLFAPKRGRLAVAYPAERGLTASDFQVGQQVQISLPEAELLRQIIWAYGLPLLSLFVIAALAQTLLPMSAWQDLGVALSGFLGLLLGWFMARRYARPILPILETIEKE